MEANTKTRFILMGGVLGVTSSAFIIRAAQQEPYTLAGIRVLITGLISFFLLNRNYSLALKVRVWRNIIIAGFCLATHFGWWFDSLNYLNVGTSLSLTNTAPVWMAIFVFLGFNQKPKLNQILSIIFVIIGSVILFFFSSDGNLDTLGLLLALGSAIGFAIYLISARETVPILGLWKYFGLVNLIAAGFLILWSINIEVISNIFIPEIWLFGALLATFPGLLGHAVYNWAIPKLDTIDVGIATLGEPILGSFLAWIVLGEMLSFVEIIGIFMLLLAISFTLDIRNSDPKIYETGS